MNLKNYFGYTCRKMSVRAITYTTPSIRLRYENEVIVPRLRGEDRNVIVRRLNKQQKANDARNKARREERTRIAEEEETQRLAEISRRVAKQVEEQEAKKEARKKRASTI